MSKKRARASRSLLLGALACLAAASVGCEIIVDFNRSLIEGGVDATFTDAGDATLADSTVDVFVGTDATSDATGDTGHDAGHDTGHDAGVDSGVSHVDSGTDSAHDVAHVDSGHDAGETKDAGEKDAPGDVRLDGAKG
jgi:hypothetical protein